MHEYCEMSFSKFLLLLLLSIFAVDAKEKRLPSSPRHYPSPQGGRSTADTDWEAAYFRARDFVGNLSLIEKLNLTSGISKFGVCVGNTRDLPDKNMWGICLQDGPLGVRATDYNSAFPAGISAAATFNRKLIYERGRAIGTEFRGKGVDVALGPAIGPIGLKALGGRIWEAMGADPYLQGVAGAETVKGMQEAGVMANAKHFLVNEQETKRFTISSNLGDRALHEIYAWPFADLIRAGVGSVMCSYNLLNNSYGCENSYLLNHVLKDELGFQGFVVSDWWATHSGVNAITSGLDMDMPGTVADSKEGQSFFGSNFTISILNGTIPMDRLDDMVTRIMSAFYKVNLDQIREERGPPNFSQNTPNDTDYLFPFVGMGPLTTINKHVDVRTDQSYGIAYQTASEAIVLLKNKNNTLPINGKRKVKKLSIFGKAAFPNMFGPDCDSKANVGCQPEQQLGASAMGFGSGSATLPYFITPFEGLNKRARSERTVVDYGYDLDTSDLTFSCMAQKSDVNVIFAMTYAGEGKDRENFTLWYNVDDVIESACELNKNNIVVVTSPGPVDMERWIENPNVTAVLFTTPGGQDSGQALADIMYGDQDPSGKLPFTIAKHTRDYVPISTGKALSSNEKQQDDEPKKRELLLDYRYFDQKNITPRYEFGFGLSYSTFSFSDLNIETVKLPDEHLPPPPDWKDPFTGNMTLINATDALFPDTGIDRIPYFVYPYINSTSQATKNMKPYPFPDEYTTKQKSNPSPAGGASGGNPVLWEVAYRVNATVTNTGDRVARHVAQLYLGYPDTKKFPSPPKQLRGFDKIELQPNETVPVRFDILVRDLSVWDSVTSSWIVQRGEYQIYVGSSSRNLDLHSQIRI